MDSSDTPKTTRLPSLLGILSVWHSGQVGISAPTVAVCMHLERPETWLHGSSKDRDVGLPDMPQLPPEHGVAAGEYLLASQQEHASKPHAHQTW